MFLFRPFSGPGGFGAQFGPETLRCGGPMLKECQTHGTFVFSAQAKLFPRLANMTWEMFQSSFVVWDMRSPYLIYFLCTKREIIIIRWFPGISFLELYRRIFIRVVLPRNGGVFKFFFPIPKLATLSSFVDTIFFVNTHECDFEIVMRHKNFGRGWISFIWMTCDAWRATRAWCDVRALATSYMCSQIRFFSYTNTPFLYGKTIEVERGFNIKRL